MTRQELECSEKKQYNMDLREVIEQKVESEGLCDHEIAGILDTNTSVIRGCRKAFGIKKTKTNAFSRRFERNYGNGSLDTFKKIVEDPEKSLADAGRYFGFTREHARYVYQRIYGCSYGERYRSKQILKAKKRSCYRRTKTKKMYHIRKVIERMNSMGIDSEIWDGPPFMILTNGYKLSLKVSSKPVMIGRRQYYLFRIGKKANPNVDFYICLCKGEKEDSHYIIPSNVIPKSGVSISYQSKPGQSKYARFREAWHQCTHGQTKNRHKVHELSIIIPFGLKDHESEVGQLGEFYKAAGCARTDFNSQ